MNTLRSAFFVGLLVLMWAGCGEDVREQGWPPGLCPEDECVVCDKSEECGPGLVCHEEEGVCVEGEDPGCVGDDCGCASGVVCGINGVCCESGESCEAVEICEEGQCEERAVCRAECEGTFCGVGGELCCEGETPVCTPKGQCAPSCEEGGALCGEDFDICCEAGDVCVFGECRTPGAPCEGFSECAHGEYCDYGLGRCMADDFPEGLVCEIDYDFDALEPQVLWRWEGVEVAGVLQHNVMMTPVVADMDGDGVPDVVVAAYSTTADAYPVVIDGATGETKYVNEHRNIDFGTQIALADITGTGLPDMVVARSNALGVIKDIESCPDPEDDEEGCYLWWSTDASSAQGATLVADITADGEVEVVFGGRIYNGRTGEVLSVSPGGGYDYTVVADITGDGRMEFLAGGCLYAVADGGDLTELWCNADLPTGTRVFVAVGDLVSEGGRTGMPEFVLTGDGTVHVVAADSGQLLESFELPGGGVGGSPIIADFDGDGNGEVGVAGQGCYTVFDFDCLGSVDGDSPGCVRPEIAACEPGVDCFDVQACPDLADSGGTGDGVLWSVYTQDLSSSRTGSSVFDFQGDGRKEVVYNDECLLMVFDGQTGSPQFRFPNTTRTSSEYPIIVDVNGDRRTNIVVSANNDQFERDCAGPIQDRPDRFPECHGDGPYPAWCTEGTSGVVALQDPDDMWVRTRAVWNQFAYHIENITDEIEVPTSPAMPWETHNTFRANLQGEVPLNAPDVVVESVQVNSRQCPPDLEFRVTVSNEGVAAVPAGLPVSLYDADTSELLRTVVVDEPISPGGMVVVEFSYGVPSSRFNVEMSFVVVANDGGEEAGLVQDCNPDTAQVLVEGIVCQYFM